MSEVISADHLRLIYDHTDDLVFLLAVTPDQEFRVLSANRSFLDASGVREDDVIGRLVSEIYPKEEYVYLRARYTETIKLGKTHRYETKTNLRAGTIYIDTMLVPIFDDHGMCSYLIGVSRDVTQRKKEQQALREAKQRAENYLDISEALIIALDTDCHLTMMNRKGYQVLGYEEGSLIGRNWCELAIRPDRRDEYMKGFREFVEEGKPRNHVNYLITSDGERLLFRSQNSFIHEDGKIVGILSSGEDITDRHRAVQAMIARQRSVAAEEVVTSVAHDFNNSLQGIIGNIEIAMAQPALSGETRRALEAASNLADDAAGRIKALRSDSSDLTEGPGQVLSLNQLVDEVVEESRHLWKDLPERDGRQIEIGQLLIEDDPHVEGRANELRSVLYNVVKNAIESISSQGSVTIETTADQRDGVIRVTDDGEGMKEEDAARAFQAFYSTKGMETGRGLGLAASHSIIRAHGGDIQITDTAPGIGTTIEIRLPRSSGALASDEPSPQLATNHHILWVDDDAAVRGIAEGFLGLLGVTGDVVDGAAVALDKLASGSYTLIITDIGMQGMSGIEFAEEVRKQDRTTPIIAITGWGDTALEDVDGAECITGLLGKPVRLENLKTLLSEYPI